MKRNRLNPLVIVVQRVVPHYRLPFFDLLARANADFDFRVYHGGSGADRKSEFSFRSRLYINRTLRLLGYTFVFQPRLMIDVLREAPDVLVLEGTFGVVTNSFLLLVRRVMGLRTLYWTAGWPNPDVRGFRSKLKSGAIRALLRMCDDAIVYGSTAKDYLTAHGCAAGKITIAQNTIDVESLIDRSEVWHEKGQVIRRELGVDTKRVLVYVGQLSPLKRVSVLLEAFEILCANLKETALLIIGDGDQKPELSRMTQVRCLEHVHMIGELVDGVEAYFAAGDVFVLPGTGGLALNQAMALALPIVATIADGTQDDLVEQGINGYTVPVDDPMALASAIEKILDDARRTEGMGAASLRIIKDRATLGNMVAKYSSAIREML